MTSLHSQPALRVGETSAFLRVGVAFALFSLTIFGSGFLRSVAAENAPRPFEPAQFATSSAAGHAVTGNNEISVLYLGRNGYQVWFATPDFLHVRTLGPIAQGSTGAPLPLGISLTNSPGFYYAVEDSSVQHLYRVSVSGNMNAGAPVVPLEVTSTVIAAAKALSAPGTFDQANGGANFLNQLKVRHQATVAIVTQLRALTAAKVQTLKDHLARETVRARNGAKQIIDQAEAQLTANESELTKLRAAFAAKLTADQQSWSSTLQLLDQLAAKALPATLIQSCGDYPLAFRPAATTLQALLERYGTETLDDSEPYRHALVFPIVTDPPPGDYGRMEQAIDEYEGKFASLGASLETCLARAQLATPSIGQVATTEYDNIERDGDALAQTSQQQVADLIAAAEALNQSIEVALDPAAMLTIQQALSPILAPLIPLSFSETNVWGPTGGGAQARYAPTTVTALASAASALATNQTCTASSGLLNFTLFGAGIIIGTPGNDGIVGNNTASAPDILVGLSGDDCIDGRDGTDIVFGGPGLDTIYGHDQVDLLFGGSGNDVIYGGNGEKLTFTIAGVTFSVYVGNLIAGDAGDDQLNGGAASGESLDRTTGYSDFIFGDGLGNNCQNANDTIDGGAGIDFLFGQCKNDNIKNTGHGVITINGVDAPFGSFFFGGGGDDTIEGGDSFDTMFGNAGNDTLKGGNAGTAMFTNINLILGNDGADTLIGGSDSDLAFGNLGVDAVSGNDGADLVSGDGDKDTVDGGPGKFDLVLGGLGDDLLKGGDGIDLVFGGTGDDVASGDDGTDAVFGNEGDDRLNGNASIDLIWGDDGKDLIDGGTDSDLAFGNRGSDQVKGGDGVDALFGNDDDDVIDGGPGMDFGWGNDGADKISGGTGADVLFGNRGGDCVDGDDNTDIIFGDSENDTLKGGGGADFIFGNTGDDLIRGGDGDDVLIGNAGNDHLYGDGDLDILFGNENNDRLVGGTGADLMFGNEGDDCLYGEGGYDTEFGNDGNDTLIAGADGGVLFGNAGNDELHGGSAASVIFGNADNDTIRGSSAGDLLFGNGENDLIDGAGGNDFIFGNDGDDTLISGGGDDWIFANDGNDVVEASDGADWAFGNRGDDDMSAYYGGSADPRDWLYGNRGDDDLWRDGAPKKDWLFGGAGSNSKTTGAWSHDLSPANTRLNNIGQRCRVIWGIKEKCLIGQADCVLDAGVTMSLVKSGQTAATDVTKGSLRTIGAALCEHIDYGNYSFTVSASGTYQVAEVAPPGTQTIPSPLPTIVVPASALDATTLDIQIPKVRNIYRAGKTGSLIIRKTVVNTLGVPSPASFDALVNCTSSGPTNLTVAVPTNGNSNPINGIAAPSSCTVTEPANQPALASIQNVKACATPGTAYGSASWTTVIAPQPAPIVANQTAMVTVTNTLRCDRKTGSLRIIKKAVNPPIPVGGAFAYMDISCTSPALSLAHQAVPYTNGLTIPGIAANSACTILEPAGVTQNVPACGGGTLTVTPSYSSPMPVTIPAGGTVTVTVTNTFTCGPPPVSSSYLKVEKIVVDPTGSAPAGYKFPISLQCSNLGGTWTPIPLAGGTCSSNDPSASCGTPIAGGPFLPGLSCKVKEDPLPLLQSSACGGYAAWSTSIAPSSVTIPQSGTALLSVTNTLRCVQIQEISTDVRPYPQASPCANVSIPMAGATDCPTAIAAAWAHVQAQQTSGCLACPAGETAEMVPSTCVQGSYIRPDGVPGNKWNVWARWVCH